MATNSTQKKGGTIGSATLDRPRGVLVANIDIAQAIAQGGALASGDLISVVTIPARSKLIVHAVVNETALVLGTTGVLELGDATDDDNYVANQTTMTAGSFATIEAIGAGTVYTAANLLALKVSNASGTITSGKVAVYYELIDLSARPDAKAYNVA